MAHPRAAGILRPGLSLLLSLALLSACGGGNSASDLPALPDGAEVVTPEFESYVTQHDGFSRVRRDATSSADAAIIAGFEDADPSDPAGYRNLIALNEAAYGGQMKIEVIAQVDDGTGPVQRLLRLTADAAPFQNEEGGRLVAATGIFYLRGHNFSWVSIDDGPILSGNDSRGLVDMTLNFDTATANLSLRTGVEAGSQVRTEINAKDLPFNIRTGAYGGDVLIRAWDPNSPDILSASGSLRGNVSGKPAYADDTHGLSTAGLYTADGIDAETGRQLSVDGVFMGVDPNALTPVP